MLCSALLTLVLLKYAVGEDCPCGWKVEDTGDVYTHRIFNDFSRSPDVQHVLSDEKAKPMMEDWMVYDF